jgi:hypothetical protein
VHDVSVEDVRGTKGIAMRITILDGSPVAGALSQYLQEVEAALEKRTHEIKLMTLRDMKIRFCTSCWSCWWKTPGECAFDDESRDVCAAVVNSDFVLMATPLIMGCQSALLKKMQDKLIPLLLPYLALVSGEVHHKKRYDAYPWFGCLFECAPETDDADLKIVTDMMGRFVLNMRSRLEFAKTTETGAQETADAIDRVQWLAPGP